MKQSCFAPRKKVIHARRDALFSSAGTVFGKMAYALPLCLLAFACAPMDAAALDCAALSSTPIYQVINPATQASLLTRWQNEANNAVQYGFTINKGELFRAAVAPADGLVAAHRLYKPSNGDFVWMINPSEIASAIQSYGYVDQGINFYVSPTPASCAQPVYRFYKNGIFRFAVSQVDRDALTASGWTTGNPLFYAGMAPSSTSEFHMGVASHLGDPGRKSDGKTDSEIALTEMGATSLRDEAGWDQVDNPGPAAATAKFKTVAKNGGKLLLILDYGNPQYLQGGGFPNTTAERKAFLEYANKMIAQIGYQNLAGIEVWNEWANYMGWFPEWGWTRPGWGAPCPDDKTDKAGCPVMYSKLVETLLYPEREGLSVPSLRQTAPGVPVVVNAISARDAEWTTASMNYLRDHKVQVDGAAIHPYVTYLNGCPGTSNAAAAGPQTAVNCVVTVSDEIARDYGKRLPMWVTEVGWSRGGDHAVTADVQARYAVETYVRARATGMVRGVWWYDLQDDNTTDKGEANYGLIGRDPADKTRPGALHPSGQAFSALAHFWAGCSSVTGAYQANNRTFQVSCPGGTRQIILAATANELAQASAKGATLVDLLGQQANVPAGGNVSLLVGRPVGVK